MGPKSLFHTSLLGLNHNTMKYETKRLLVLSSVLWLVLASAFIPPASGNALKNSKSIFCADDKCQALYGKGHTITRYPSPGKGILSFKKDAAVLIFGRTEDRQHLYVEINNSRGLVPTAHIQEDSIVNPELTFKVDLTADSNQNQLNSSVDPPSESTATGETPQMSGTPPSPAIKDKPDPQFVYASKSATVIEGTTFYDDILKTSTPSPTFSADAVTKTVTIEANFSQPELDKESSAADASKVESSEQVSPSDQNDSEQLNLSDTQASVSKDGEEKATMVESNLTQNSETVQEESVDSAPQELNNDQQVVSVQNASENVVPAVELDSSPEKIDPIETASSAEQTSEQQQQIDGQSETKETPKDADENLSEVNDTAAIEDEANVNSVLSENEPKVEDLDMAEPVAASSETVESITKSENQSAKQASSHVDDTAYEQVASESKSENVEKQENDQQVQSPNSSESVAPVQSEDLPPPPAAEHFLPLNESPKIESVPEVLPNSAVDNAQPNQSVSLTVDAVAPNETATSNESEQKQPETPAVLGSVEGSILPYSDDSQLPSQQLNLVSDLSPPNPLSDNSFVVSNPSTANPSAFAPEQQPPNHLNNLPPGGQYQPPNVAPTGDQAQPQHNPSDNYRPVPNRFHRRLDPNSVPRGQPVGNPDPNPHPQQNVQNSHVPSPPPLPIHSFVPPNPDPSTHEIPVPPYPSHLNTPPVVPIPNVPESAPQPDLSQPILSNLHADAKIIPQAPEANAWNQQPPSLQPQQQQQQPDPVNHIQPHSNSVNPSVPDSAPSYPASDTLVDPEKYAATGNTNNNVSRRKLLAEKVAFVGVIMDIIPDEVELFFENFNVSIHVFVLSSIIAFFWGFTKVVITFFNSARKQRELRDINSQVQRKLYYFEAEKDKLNEEANAARERLLIRDTEFRNIEHRKSRLEHENEALKNEKNRLTNEVEHLRSRATEATQNSSKLNATLDNLGKIHEEKKELETLNEELEERIVKLEEEKRDLEKTTETLNKEIKNLNMENRKAAEETDDLKIRLEEIEESYAISQSQTQNLQSEKIALNEELRNLKDELVSSQEKCGQLEETCATQESELEVTREKISSLTEELNARNTELVSMQALLSKLNKNISNKERRRLSQMSSEGLNGDITDAVNGDSVLSDISNIDSATVESVALGKSDDDAENDMQDIVKLQLRLTNIEIEKKHLESKIESLEFQLQAAKTELEGLKSSNESLKKETENASHERLKAVMELEVLTKYYKEKELEYGKEIGVQRVKREQKEEDATSLASRLESYQEENEMLKKHLKSTKKELEETERRYKGQLNSLEKQSHENWIAARNAERKFEESKAEATALRQTLTMSVKSPPPADLSLSGFLDDSASSMSSLHDGLNASIQLPPPPPPPPLMMMNSLIPPPPPPMGPIPAGAGQHPIYGDLNDSSFWNTSSGPSSLGMLPPASSAANTSLTNSMPPNSSDASMVFVQSGQPMSNQPPPSTQVANQYQAYAPQQHHPYQQWEELSRNTYSPALSQRSATATPHTGLTMVPTSAAATSQAYAVQHHQQQQSAAQQYQQQQHYGSEANAANPYSISSYQNHYGQQASAYQQQPQQQTVDPNAAFGATGSTATLPASQSHQIWTAGQPQINDPNNVYTSYPTHANNSYGGGTMPQVTESNSRPASVHTQMV